MITLYLDMDGVIANFNKAFSVYKTEHAEDHIRFRDAVMEGKIFENLEKMPGADLLLEQAALFYSWGYIDVQILTSMGTFDQERGEEAKRQKKLWLAKHNIPYTANFVRTKPEKALYAHKFSILVDDSIGCINPFNEKGGHGVLHTRVHETLWNLNKIISELISVGAKLS
jgi:hypothetical protein